MTSSSPRSRVLPLATLLTALLVTAPLAVAAPQAAGSNPLVVDAPNATPFDATGYDLVTGAATQDFSTLGTFALPSGASITLEFDVTVNSVIPAGTSAVANQGSVGADQLLMSVASDDPTTGMSPDPTVTLLFEEADLGITKSDNPASATSIPGNSITYSVVVTNAGPFGVLDAEVSDLFPAALSNCSWACAGTGNCDTTMGMGNITAVTVDLEVGESVTFSATCDIDPTATGMLANTATVDPPDGFSDPGVFPNMATDTNTLVPTGDLSIDKTTVTTPVVPGNAIQYTIVVANTGPSTATGVDVTDTFPGDVTGVTWTCAPAGGAACPNAAGAGDVSETVDLPAGGSVTYTVDGTVDAGAVGSIMNTASLTVPAGFTDTDGSNDSDTVTDNLDPMIDVAVTKTTLTATPLVPGAMVQYQVVVDNGGPSDAIGVAVTDTFAGTLSNVSWTCAADAGSSCAAMGIGDINDTANIAAGEMVTYTVTATISPTATGMLTNTASITPPMGVTDASDGDDSSTVMDALSPQGDLSIDKQTLTSPVVAGQMVSYQIVVANTGPSTAVGAQVQDNFPMALNGASWTCVASAGSSCTAGPVAGDVLDMVTVAGGGNVTYTVTGTLDAAATGVLSNTATVSIPGGFTDTNMGNESDTVMNVISVVTDLMIMKQDAGPVEPGDPIVYTLVVTNLGPSDVVGATVTDVVPAALSNVTWTCVADMGASCTAGPVMGDVNDSVDLPVGASVTYTLTGDAPDMPAMVENTASVEAPAGATDPDGDNDSDTVISMVARPVIIPTLSPLGFALLALLLAGLGLWLLRRRGALAAGLVLLVLVGFAGAADAQTLVDDFSTAQGPNEDPPGVISSTADGAGILGGERDVLVTRNSGAGTVSGEATGGDFLFDAPAATAGEALLVWDGNDDDPEMFDPVGLPSVNLTTTGQSGFRLDFDDVDAGVELIVRVYTDGANHSVAGRLVTTGGAASIFIPFSEFRSSAGAGADFTDVGAISLTFRGAGVSAQLENFATAGPLLVVEKVDLDPNTNTEIGLTEVAAGSTIRYRVTVTNQGAEATTVDVNDVVDGNTTLVANTLNSTPVASPDAYRWYGNVTLTIPALAGLFTNDADPDGDTFTITAFDAASVQGGTVQNVDVNTGAFDYLPPPGFTGIDSFTYTIEDDDGNSSTTTVTVSLLSTIWFVDSDRCAFAMLPCGTGTQADPFGSLVQAELASGAGDIIRLRQGGADLTHHNAGIALKPTQRLIGEGVDLVIDGVHIEGNGAADANLDPNPANRPSLTHASMGGEGITLASGAEVQGLNVNASMDSAIFGNFLNGVFIDHVSVIDSGGSAVEVTNSIGVDMTFTALDSLNSFEHAVHLDAVAGTMTVTGATQLDNPAMSGIRIENSPGFSASFGAVNVTGAGGMSAHAAIHLASNAGGTFTFGAMNLDSENGDGFFALNGGTVNHPSSGNTVNAVGGAAVDVESTTGNAGGSPGWSFDTLASTGSPDQGVRLVSLAQDFNVSDASTTITDPDVVGILVQNSGAGVDYDFGPTSVTDTNVGMGATANGIDLATGNSMATFTFDSLAVVTDGGFGLLANNSGTINVAGTDGNSIVANGGAALDVTSTSAGSGWTFDTLSSMNSPGTGVNLVSFSGTVTGEAGAISGSAGTAFNVDGGGPTVTYSGSVTQNAAQRVVNVEDTTGGAVNFNTGTVTGGAASLGVRIDNADGNASFADLNLGTMGSPMTNQALTLSGGSTGTFGFADTQIFTNGANGVHASNGGVVEFTTGATGNQVTATNGRALTFDGGTTIGMAGATFQRIDASGSDRGIRLANAGSGFTVTGTATTDGTGGTIQNISQRGIEIIQTSTISLSNMTLTNAATNNGPGPCPDAVSAGANTGCNAPVYLETLSDPVLTNLDITGSAQHGLNGWQVTNLSLINSTILNAGNEVGENGAKLFNLFGTSLIDGTTIDNSFRDNLRVQNDSPTQLNLTVDNSFLTDSVGGLGMQFSGRGNSRMNLQLEDSEVTGNGSSGIQPQGSDDTTASGGAFEFRIHRTIFENNAAAAIDLGAVGQSPLYFEIMNNGTAMRPLTFHGSHVISVNQGGNPAVPFTTASVDGVISGNFIGTAAANSGTSSGSAIRVVENQSGTVRVLIENNVLRGWTDQGILVLARDAPGGSGSSDVDVTIRGNTISDPSGGFEIAGITVQGGAANLANELHDICASIGENIAMAERNNVTVGTNAIAGIWVRQRFNTTMSLFQGASASAVPATVLTDNNDITAAAPASQALASGTVPVVMTACDLPVAP